MTASKVTLVLDYYDGEGNPVVTGSVTLAPNVPVSDSADHVLITRAPVRVSLFGNPAPSVQVIATDSAGLTPAGWAWSIQPTFPGAPEGALYQIPATGGSTQYMSQLTPAVGPPSISTPIPVTGTPSAGQVVTATGPASADWETPAAGGISPPAGDIGGTRSAPTVAKIQGTVISAPPGGTTQFLRGDGTWQVVSGGGGGIAPPAGDIGGTAGAPTVTATHLSSPLPLAQGGTAAATKTAARASLGIALDLKADFGAVGNGTADDTTALASWIAAINATTVPALVIVPPGQFITSSPLPAITAAGVTIRGSGWAQTAVNSGTVIQASSSYSGGTMVTVTAEGVSFEWLTLDGSNKAATVLAGTANHLHVVSSQVRGPLGTASPPVCIDIQAGCTSAWIYGSVINGLNGASIGVQVNSTDTIIANCKPQNSAYNVVLLSGASGCQILGNHMTPGSSHGVNCIWMNGTPSHVMIQDNRFDNYPQSAVQLSPPTGSIASDIQVSGNMFMSQLQPDSTYALVALDTTNAGIKGLRVTGNTGYAQSGNRPSYGFAAQTQAGATPANTGRVASLGTMLSGNTFWAATALYGHCTPAVARGNILTTDGSTYAEQPDVTVNGGLPGVSLSGTPSAGQVPVATSSSAASWQGIAPAVWTPSDPTGATDMTTELQTFRTANPGKLIKVADGSRILLKNCFSGVTTGDILLDFSNCTIVYDHSTASDYAIVCDNTANASSEVSVSSMAMATVNTDATVTQVTLGSTLSAKRFDWVAVYSTDANPAISGGQYGEIFQLLADEASLVLSATRKLNNYGKYATSVKARKLDATRRVYIKGGIVTANDNTEDTSITTRAGGILIQGFVDAVAEGITFDHPWAACLRFQATAGSKARDITVRNVGNLANYNGYTYGCYFYGMNDSCDARNLVVRNGRHAGFTTDGNSSSSTTWYNKGIPTNLVVSGVHGYNCHASVVDTHEEGDGIIIENVHDFYPYQDADIAGGFTGLGCQIRASNVTLRNFTVYGGTRAIKVNAVDHGFEDQVTLQGISVMHTTQTASTDGDTAITVDDQSGLANKRHVYLDGVTLNDAGTGVSVGKTAKVTASSVVMRRLGTAMDVGAGALVTFTGHCELDYRNDPRTAPYQGFLCRSDGTYGGCSLVFLEAPKILKGDNSPAYLLTESDTTATKLIWVPGLIQYNAGAYADTVITNPAATSFAAAAVTGTAAPGDAAQSPGFLGTDMIPVTTASQLNPGPTFLTGGGTSSRLKYQAVQDCATFRVAYWNGLNVGTLNPPGQAGPNPIKVRASIEVGNGGIAAYRYVPTTTAYAGGTTYALGARVSSAGVYYVSLQAGNVGNTPASSPAFWAAILNTGAVYNPATAYTPGMLAGLPAGAAYYICIASTTGNTPPNASFWALVTSSSTAYDATITYNPQDQVTSAGSSWVCLQTSLGHAPAAGSAFWRQAYYYPVPFAGQDGNRDVTIAPGEVVVSEPLGISPGLTAGQFCYVNTMTQPTARTDTVTGTSGSATVTDAAITAADQGRALAAATGIPAGTCVGTVTAGTSFLMSSTPYAQVSVNATANFSSCQILGVPNQGSYPRGNIIYWAAGDFEQHASAGTAPEDYTLAGPTTRVSNADTTTSHCPVAVLGLPAAGTAGRKVIAIAGDSIVNGTGDDTLTFGDEALGWALRMLTDNPASPARFEWSYLRMARGSSAGAYQYGPGVSVMMALAAGCTHVLDEWIVNDIGIGGMTLAALQANAVARWTAWAKLGLKVVGVTSTPNATSTDSYATVANQAPAAGFGASSLWSQYNAWVLGVPSPLSGVIDVASVVTNTAPGGSNAAGTVWQPGMISLTAGTPHPSLAGHIAIAQSVSPAALFT